MASKALSLFLLPSGSAGIRHAANSPQFELIPIPVAIASKLQRSQPVIKFGANLLPNRSFIPCVGSLNAQFTQ